MAAMRHIIRGRLRLMQRRIRWRLVSAIPFALIAGSIFTVVSLMGYGGSFRRTGIPDPSPLDEIWRPFLFVAAFTYVVTVFWPFSLTTRDGWREEAPPAFNWSESVAERPDAVSSQPGKLQLFVSLWLGLTVLVLAYGSLLGWLALRWGSAAEALEIKQMGSLPLAWIFPSLVITPATKSIAAGGIIFANCFLYAVTLTAVLWLTRLRLDQPFTELDISGRDSQDGSPRH